MEENKNNADNHDGIKHLIVMGASAGGFEALKTIVKDLPSDFETPILIVWHMSPDVRGILPQVFNNLGEIYAAHAYDKEELKPHRIYVAPPDYHMLLDDGKIRVSHGPKENRFRPAVDPLFRSAAYSYGKRVIGVILSGGMDDGVAGLWTIKHYGGTTVIQDPKEAEVPSMPQNASTQVKIDYSVPSFKITELLVKLSKRPITQTNDIMKDEQTKKEIEIASEANTLEKNFLIFPRLTPFTCPECNGVLSRLQNDNIIRFRCHTGHAYSLDSLMAALNEKIEDNMYNAIRAIAESIILLNHMGDHYAEINQPKLAALYFKKAKEAENRSQLIRQAAFSHEQFSSESLKEAVKNEKLDVEE
ncbi:MAG: chemotaxis protein CheB [Bacteroidetes bacterium]|nr:MAG: chemotaxis protein CheB [Bacteroidota bacterium]